MKILIDINHPAHVHYFRNFIKIMEAKGHEFCVINRDSKIINQLLDHYGIKHITRGKRPEKKSTLRSMWYLLQMTGRCIKESFKFHPDMYVGFGSNACAFASFLFRKPCILLEDTEHNALGYRLYLPFCSAALTPFYFKVDLSKYFGGSGKQIEFNGYIEQLFLHSKQYQKSASVLSELGLEAGKYVLVRYIAYDAHHDLAAHPLSEEAKKKIIKQIEKHYKVVLSLEKPSDDPFYQPYLYKYTPDKMHDIEAGAKFMVTEGATMASESFVHGVPYIYLNPLKCGNIDYQCEHYPNRCIQTTDEQEAFAAVERLCNAEINCDEERKKVEDVTINPTDLLVWFVENYPESKKIMQDNPDYQNRFK